jgi:LPS-assembly lipoprotein
MTDGPPSPSLPHKGGGRIGRLCFALSLALLTAGCFQPLYGDSKVVPTAGLDDRLGTVEVAKIDAPNGTRLARVGVEVRNDLIFDMTGGGGGQTAAYTLNVKLSASQSQVIVDINSNRPDIQNYGINASFTLVDVGTGKPVVSGTTFSRVSYNIPGQQQRFAGDRGLRDAENRAAKVIADNIRDRLASYFVAGT